MDAAIYSNRIQRISSNLEAGTQQRKTERPATELNAEFLNLLGKALNGLKKNGNSTAEPLLDNGIVANDLGLAESIVNSYLCNGSAVLDPAVESCDESSLSDDKREDKDPLNYDLLSNGMAVTYMPGEDTNGIKPNLADNGIRIASNPPGDVDLSAITGTQEQKSRLNIIGSTNPGDIQFIQSQTKVSNSAIKSGAEDAVEDWQKTGDNMQNIGTAKDPAEESAGDLFSARSKVSQSGVTAEQTFKEQEFGIDLSGYSIVKDTEIQSLSKAGEPYQQISFEILDRLEKKGGGEFKLQLEPENLGQIDIKLKWSDGKLIIDILAFSPKTHALLASQVDKLVMNLGLQNVQIEQIQVSQSADNGVSNPSQQNQPFMMNSGMSFSQGRQQESDSGQSTGTYSEPLPDTKPEHLEMPQNREYDGHQLNYVV